MGSAQDGAYRTAAYRQKLRELLVRSEPMIRAMLAAKRTYSDVAARVGLKRTTIYSFARSQQIPGPQRRLPAAKRRTVERDIRAARLNQAEIAARHEVGTATVSRLRSLYLRVQSGVQKKTRTLKTPRRCPNGHLVTEWPCMACDLREQSRAAGVR